MAVSSRKMIFLGLLVENEDDESGLSIIFRPPFYFIFKDLSLSDSTSLFKLTKRLPSNYNQRD